MFRILTCLSKSSSERWSASSSIDRLRFLAVNLRSLIFCLLFLICFSSLSSAMSMAEYMSFVSSLPMMVSLSPAILISAMCRNFSTASTTLASAGLSRNLSKRSNFSLTYAFKWSEGSRFLNVTDVCIPLSLPIFVCVYWMAKFSKSRGIWRPSCARCESLHFLKSGLSYHHCKAFGDFLLK